MPAKAIAGWLAGLALAPLTGSVSALRRSRMFHPRGVVCRAEVEAAPGSPFLVGARRIEWRLAPEREAPPGPSRDERLERAVREGPASLRLELADYSGPLFPPVGESFQSVVRLHLRERVELDQEALRFDPFRDGRGITPVGFVHFMRKATYLTSQRARPPHQR